MTPGTKCTLHACLVYICRERRLSRTVGSHVRLGTVAGCPDGRTEPGLHADRQLASSYSQGVQVKHSAKASPAVLQQIHLCQIILRSCWLTETQIPPERSELQAAATCSLNIPGPKSCTQKHNFSRGSKPRKLSHLLEPIICIYIYTYIYIYIYTYFLTGSHVHQLFSSSL